MSTSFVSPVESSKPVESSGFEAVFNQFTEIGSALVFDLNTARKRFVSNMLAVRQLVAITTRKSRYTHPIYIPCSLPFCKQSHSYEIATSERQSLLALNAMTSM